MIVRERLEAALKDASEAGERRTAATLRLVLTALRERDYVARMDSDAGGLSDEEILGMLRAMVEQRRAEIGRCEACAQIGLAEREAEEIRILEQFLPPQMDEGQIRGAVEAAIQSVGATRLKDAGRVIASLKEQFDGRMDFVTAKRLLCERLR